MVAEPNTIHGITKTLREQEGALDDLKRYDQEGFKKWGSDRAIAINLSNSNRQ